MDGWLPALRIAWRDALRHRGRSVLVLVLVSLPVLAVSAAAVVIKTAEVSGIEAADRELGAADARIRTEGGGRVVQAPDPTRGDWGSVGGLDPEDALTEEDLRAVLGADTRLVPMTGNGGAARVGERIVDFEMTGIDLADPLAEGLFELGSGRLPDAPGEVVVNDAMIAKGFAVGDELDVNGATLRIVGSGRDASSRAYPVLLGSVQDVAEDSSNVREWLAASGPVTWSQVLELNERGGVVTSRAVLADPPDVASMAEQMGYDTGQDETYAVAALIVVMALIEVVLLAGPAFAVGARRHARTFALIAASGGTPAQARKVILGSGVVLGVVATALGLVLGIVAGWAALPLVQRFNGEWFGPFELPWAYLAAIVVFGLLSALLAAVAPAWIASRQDVVAVLGGRRGDPRPRASTPFLGLALLGVGTAGSAYGALTSDSGNGAIWMAASAVVSVLGMILVVPVVVATVARLSRRLPLTARYAARDADRHRTRTIPAVAAVAATVAGVVALGIANASDERENEATYWPQAAMGTGRLHWAPAVLPGEQAPDTEAAWDRIEQVVRDTAPDVTTQRVQGPKESFERGSYTGTYAELPASLRDRTYDMSVYGPPVAVAESAVEVGIDGDIAALVDEALGDGRAVVLVSGDPTPTTVTIRQETWQDSQPEPVVSVVGEVEAELVTWDMAERGHAPAGAILPGRVADELGIEVETTSLLLTGDLDRQTETRIKESVQGAVGEVYLYVERGYQRPAEAVIILLVLGVLGGVLMLGGTLTATFLALSDARPDLATLSAVGAAPRTRRRVAASYALVVGFVGAILGAAVGLIPGIAISRPLTSTAFAGGGSGEHGPYLAIPWLLIGTIVLVLPLVTAAVVGLSARSRLPLVARLD